MSTKIYIPREFSITGQTSEYESEKKLNVVIFRCPVIVDKTRAHRLGILFEFISIPKNILKISVEYSL